MKLIKHVVKASPIGIMRASRDTDNIETILTSPSTTP